MTLFILENRQEHFFFKVFTIFLFYFRPMPAA